MNQENAKRQVNATKAEQENILKHFMEEWIIYVLRTYSSKEHPLGITEISDMICDLTGLGIKSISSEQDEKSGNISKTVGRKLSELEMMGRAFNSTNNSKNTIAEAFYKVIGGEVRAVDGRPVRYYFEPILGSGEVSMICAAIESNHYLSEKETDYLIRRECAALGYRDDDKTFYPDLSADSKVSGLPKKPESIKDKSLPPAKASVTLKKFSIIQYAIRKKLKIKIIPGTYSTHDRKIVFAQKRETASILNPYAMICQNGQYYIIVTHEGFENPTHYRIDRLFSVELCRNEEPGRHPLYKKRDEVPFKLQRFFGKNGKFNAESYTSVYPLMAYYGETGIKKCSFLCRKEAITVAIDHFGIGDTVSIQDCDIDDYVKVTVLADYDNVKMFCTQQNQIVRPLEPEELKTQVISALNMVSEEIGRKY